MTNPKNLALSSITLDPEIQPRQHLNQDVVTEYAEAMRRGDQFPPVIVFYDGTNHWLADGFHRVKAKLSIGGCHILIKLIPGTRREAFLYAVGANATHGLQRTNADKRRAAERLLRDDEWSQWSDREIARRCGVSHETVRGLRNALSVKVCQRQKRLVRRKGRVQNMDTSNIGCKAAKTKAHNPIKEDISKKSANFSAFPDIYTQFAQQDSKDNLGANKKIPKTNGHVQQTLPTSDTTKRGLQTPTSQEAQNSHPFCIVRMVLDFLETTNEYLEIRAQFFVQGPTHALPTIVTQMQKDQEFAQNVLQQAEDRSENKAA